MTTRDGAAISIKDWGLGTADGVQPWLAAERRLVDDQLSVDLSLHVAA
jgi:hypothetical protein